MKKSAQKLDKKSQMGFRMAKEQNRDLRDDVYKPLGKKRNNQSI